MPPRRSGPPRTTRRAGFVIDADHPLLDWRRRATTDPVSDALAWNVFRTLQRMGLALPTLAQRIPNWEGNERQPHKVLFWMRNPEDREPHVAPDVQQAVDHIEPAAREPIEVDVLVLGTSVTVAIEGLAGEPGKPEDAWSLRRGAVAREYGRFANLFRPDFKLDRDGRRFHRLMRAWILSHVLAREKRAYLIAVANEASKGPRGVLHEEEFAAFREILPPDRADAALLFSWQMLYRDIRRAHHAPELGETLFDDLRRWMEANPALGLR